MRTMIRDSLWMIAVASVGILAGGSNATAELLHLRGDLVHQVATPTPTGTGSAEIRIDTVARTLRFQATYQGLNNNVSASHIHAQATANTFRPFFAQFQRNMGGDPCTPPPWVDTSPDEGEDPSGQEKNPSFRGVSVSSPNEGGISRRWWNKGEGAWLHPCRSRAAGNARSRRGCRGRPCRRRR